MCVECRAKNSGLHRMRRDSPQKTSRRDERLRCKAPHPTPSASSINRGAPLRCMNADMRKVENCLITFKGNLV